MKVIECLQIACPCEIEEMLTIFLMSALRSILEHHKISPAIIAGLIEGNGVLYKNMAHEFLLHEVERIRNG